MNVFSTGRIARPASGPNKSRLWNFKACDWIFSPWDWNFKAWICAAPVRGGRCGVRYALRPKKYLRRGGAGSGAAGLFSSGYGMRVG